ncbi:hypothetical protein [Nostoc sp. UHCC 0302]
MAQLVLLAKEFDIDFEDILIVNINKLHKRIQNGTQLGSGDDR